MCGLLNVVMHYSLNLSLNDLITNKNMGRVTNFLSSLMIAFPVMWTIYPSKKGAVPFVTRVLANIHFVAVVLS